MLVLYYDIRYTLIVLFIMRKLQLKYETHLFYKLIIKN